MGGEKLKSHCPRSGVILFALIVCVFFSHITPLCAQTSEGGNLPTQDNIFSGESNIIIGETPVVPVPDGGSSIGVVIRMVLVLALAALAIYGIVFFIKRLSRPQENRDPNLKLLARLPLGSDSFAAVVSLGARAWLVGGGSGGVNLITEIDDSETLETLLLDDARRTAEAETRGLLDFQSLIRRFKGAPKDRDLSGSIDPAGSIDPGGSHAEALRKQRERLKGL